MKTLIIAGTYKHYQAEGGQNIGGITYKVHYDVTLYSQTKERPLMECIGFIDQETNGFEELQRLARARYCEWFKTDLNNIVSMETLVIKKP